MATEHMRDGVIRAIRRGTHHGGGFSCWHTRAVGWAVSVAFTFLPKIEGYGGGSRPFFLYLSSSSPSSFSAILLFPLFLFSLTSLSFSPSAPTSRLVFISFAFSSYRHVFAPRLPFTSLKFLFFGVRVVEHTRASETWKGVVHPHPSQRCTCQNNKKTSESVATPAIRRTLVSCRSSHRAPAASFRRLYFFKTPRGLKGLQTILDC